MAAPIDNEILLFRQIGEGNEIAFRKVYDHYYRQLHGFVLKAVKSDPVAEEIVQETFARLWENRKALGDKGYSGPWLFRVAANLSYDYIRKAANEAKYFNLLATTPGEPSNNNVTEYIESVQSNNLLYEAIEQLPPQRRTIFQLSRLKGLSHQEISQYLNISENTVKNQLVTALKAVRQFMNDATRIFF
ncbi:RNA polymerase sigma factor [Chitinophaga rhizophila]|uniref:RNA polymerase sigma-70 factor n=1 Tax=Chitinophaga rhizophila TaxID=2866212 RepID=A0ABS7GAV6_9BACT|nr:RNA polymerase sigma-70 factor [Chitinophaga rhizophila]MBW8684798.1 RNA polymerase sigma-70 factor [Chitinophaga rhizophila]